MDSLWDNPDHDNRIHGIFKFTDSPAPGNGTPLECECLSTDPPPGEIVGGPIPSWPSTKCQEDPDWATWLNNPALNVASKKRAFAAILVPRTPERPDYNYPSNYHTRVLEYLPFKQAIFKTIGEKMLLHFRAMAVLLHRGVPVISRIPAKFHDIDCQVYILRIQHDFKDSHQELVVTHVPDLTQPPAVSPRGRKTYAMILGTSDYDIKEYTRKLKYFDRDTISSPWTIIKVFLELERDRRWAEVNKKMTAFHRKFFNMDKDKDDKPAPRTAIQGFNASSDPEGLVKLYLDISILKNNLSSWSVQIEGFLKTITDDTPNNTTADFKYMQAFLSMLVCEYQSKINKCETMLQGASLAFQMETVNLSRMDTNIALRDGKQMKAIALLTMIFLPATFIATLLAVPQFESIKAQGPGDYPAWTWYLILFLPLTAVVLFAYGLWICYHKPKGLQDLGSNV